VSTAPREVKSLTSLPIIKQIFKEISTNLTEESNTSDSQQLEGLVNWCVEKLGTMAQFVKVNRSTFNLMQALEKQEDKSKLLAIHNQLPNKGVNASGTIIQFKKHGLKLREFSKVQFFADSDMSKLLWQTEGTENVWNEYFNNQDTKPQAYFPP